MNQLAQEKSPYLLQHQDNPVHWYAWGEQAFKAAKAQDKPIFLSIGYATCHWCHVMAHESFEDTHVAQFLNQHFISIKLDREERPDVDQIYMEAVVAITGHGGWPLTAFLTHELKPFYGGTYYPKAQFLQLLGQIQQTWQTARDKINESAAQIFTALQQQNAATTTATTTSALLDTAFLQMKRSFDSEAGGFGGAPKFPRCTNLSLLLRLYQHNQDPYALHMVETTLQKMAYGGIYDHLGGGFARYATDAAWQVPHFEKMLYDNAQLVQNYLETYLVTQKPFYAEVARETLDYVLRELTHPMGAHPMGAHPEGGFYCAQDADSEGEEGKYYVWQEAELKSALQTLNYSHFRHVFGITPSGNFEHGNNILAIQTPHLWHERQALLPERSKLLELRQKRIAPLTDDKIITAWNGLMIAAMAQGYQVLGEAKYLHAAQRSAQMLRQNLFVNGKLLRRYRDGDSRFAADLTDHAFLIQGLLRLYDADFDSSWLDWAVQLQQAQDQLFWDEASASYTFGAANQTDLIWRRHDFADQALPNGNAVTALNLLQLHGLTLQTAWRQRAQQLLQAGANWVGNYPMSYAQLLIALDYQQQGGHEIALVADPQAPLAQSLCQKLWQRFLPYRVVAIGALPNSLELLKHKQTNLIYCCRQHVCQAPIADITMLDRTLL